MNIQFSLDNLAHYGKIILNFYLTFNTHERQKNIIASLSWVYGYIYLPKYYFLKAEIYYSMSRRQFGFSTFLGHSQPHFPFMCSDIGFLINYFSNISIDPIERVEKNGENKTVIL